MDTNLDTIVGKIQWTGTPTPNVAKTPLVGGQWKKGTDFPYDLVIVSNEGQPDDPDRPGRSSRSRADGRRVEEGDRSAPLLELDGLQRAFGNVVVADDLSLSIAPGETLGVVGPNGAGKTSVLNLITGALRADGGRILLDGVDITRHAAHERARLGIGRTYQVPRPFGGMTVFENVLLGATYAPGLVVMQAGVRPRPRSRRSSGPISSIGPTRWPAGCRSSTASASSWPARSPRGRSLLLLDEIAGGLTEAEVRDLVVTIRRLRTEGVTIIWIEHIVHALVSAVDRLVAMSFGRKLAEGDPGWSSPTPRSRRSTSGRRRRRRDGGRGAPGAGR